MYYLLFIFYLSLFCIGINYIGFIKKAGFDKTTLLLLFLIKIAAGLCIGWISVTYFYGSDYGAANMYGWAEYLILINDPYRFLTSLFDAGYSEGYGGVFDSVNSFWHDLAGNCLYKLLAIFNIFSRGNYYINILFLNVIGFIGHIALFRVFNDVYKNKKWPVMAGCFLLPSTLYFSSGLHKDNLIFTFVCVFSYALYFSISRTPSLKKTFWLLAAALILFLIRNFVLVALLPASIGVWLALKKGYVWRSYFTVYVIFLITLFSTVLLSPGKNPLHIITQKQQDFLALGKATTQVEMDTLQPTIASFMSQLPSSFERGFLRPYFWETSAPYLFLPGLEILFYLMLILFALLSKPRDSLSPHPFSLFGILSACTILLFIGYVVPNLGAIIRYRSLYLPFFLIPALVKAHITYYKK